MQKQQVFKVKGMQRDASMANANGEFAYEILNMRLMPAEDLSGFSLTNEKGTTQVITGIHGQVIGQCPTNDSLVFFTVDSEPEDETKPNYIYELWEGIGDDPEAEDYSDVKWRLKVLYNGNLNFSVDNPIEALFNYETEDIQKIYWIDGLNQLRCINLVASDSEKDGWNNQSFDSVKEINSIPSVEIERVVGGNFTAGVIQYYVTYFNKHLSESPIVYTSPLLYIANDNRGANVNDQVPTAFKLTFTDLDTTNWEYIRIYATHRTSIDATPEASIVTELNMNTSTIDFTDYGSNRTSIAPTDLYFTGGKFVKAGTMTAKDQVMFLGNLNIEAPETVSVVEIQQLFDSIRDNNDHPFTTTTRKTKENKLEEYEDTHYYYKNQLNNTESITHYKYGEKYRFGISVLDKYGNWSNPIWIKDAFIEVPPEQVDRDTLALPCPSLDLSYSLTYKGETKTLLEHLQSRGAISIKPLVVFPKEDERKVIAQGVVCPTVYNLKDRKENGPYAQASWFMRPNAPIDLWGVPKDPIGLKVTSDPESYNRNEQTLVIWHYSDLIDSNFDSTKSLEDPRGLFGYFGVADNTPLGETIPSPASLMIDDGYSQVIGENIDLSSKELSFKRFEKSASTDVGLKFTDKGKFKIWHVNFYNNVVQKGSWVEFRHNYALRSKGWSLGAVSGEVSDDGSYDGSLFGFGNNDNNNGHEIQDGLIPGAFRCAEIGATRYHWMLPVNRCFRAADGKLYFRQVGESGWDVENNFITGNSAYYVDSSIVTLNTPELELSEKLLNRNFENLNFRVVGIIPLTATVSDMSLEINNPAPNLYSYTVGPHVVHTTNTNIGHHGFKGVVAANTYYSQPRETGYSYRTVLLNPWQTTGTIQAVPSSATGFGDSDTLKRKILSNLRYSASSFYLSSGNFSLGTPDTDNSLWKEYSKAEEKNEVKLANKLIGWKPANGISAAVWNNKEGTSIIKLIAGKSTLDLVYRGNIDVIALASNKEGTNSVDIFPALGGKGRTENYYYGSGFYAEQAYKYSAKGASIKYKSSPHFVIAFKEFPKNELWGRGEKYTQEILPTFRYINASGIPAGYAYRNFGSDLGELYEDQEFGSIPHQSQFVFKTGDNTNLAFGLPGYESSLTQSSSGYMSPSYGWLWLGELYRESDPTFGGTEEYAFLNNQWEIGGIATNLDDLNWKVHYTPKIPEGIDTITTIIEGSNENKIDGKTLGKGEFEASSVFYKNSYAGLKFSANASLPKFNSSGWSSIAYSIYIKSGSRLHQQMLEKLYTTSLQDHLLITSQTAWEGEILEDGLDLNKSQITIRLANYDTSQIDASQISSIKLGSNDTGETAADAPFDVTIQFDDNNNKTISTTFKCIFTRKDIDIPQKPDFSSIRWTQGDTYYQRFDTLKTYAYSDSDQNSVIDITSFMVETRINIDGRTDRNRGQESNLQMSPTNFNLMNDIYSQRDNFFTYRILDEDLQARTNFPNQITWSLTKTAGATVDAWMNITLASVLDLDGTKGELTALKNFNNNIIAFQEKGLSHIMFNSRAQIATSEAVPIQIANTGKVDGQQYLTTDVGCQDKWSIVTTPNGLYFIDYFNKSIYRFNSQLEDISTPNGFRSWCYENLNSTANILGYYDVKNKEVMYYIGDTGFTLDQQYEEIDADGTISLISIKPTWLGFSELTGAFSSFYTYPKAWFANVQDQGLWLLSGINTKVYTHQTGEYNKLLNTNCQYGLTVIPRQDSNLVKTFNNVEFRADSYNNSILDNNHTFDTISAETEYQTRTTDTLTYSQYRPSNLKKRLRTWRANIPRVNNGYNRFVNQWAKIGLWKINPSTEKTILHDLSVWYSE